MGIFSAINIFGYPALFVLFWNVLGLNLRFHAGHVSYWSAFLAFAIVYIFFFCIGVAWKKAATAVNAQAKLFRRR